MNSEYNKIDDIFRKALEGAAEQPSAGLWRKISGRLFWKEITQFNFTNLPGGWAGMAAVGVVVATLLVYNFSSSSPEITTSLNTPENSALIKANDQQNEPVKALEKTNNGESLEKTSLVGNNETINAASKIQDKPSETLTDTQFSNTEQKTAINETETATNASSTKSLAEKSSKAEKSKATKANDLAEILGLSKQNEITEPSTPPFDKGEQQKLLSETETKLLNEQQRRELELGQLETRRGIIAPVKDHSELSEIPNSGNDLRLQGSEALAVTERNYYKVQRMNAKAFTFGPLFQGKYKPPQRNFEEKNKAKYRGKNHLFSVAAYFAPEIIQYDRTASTSREQNFLGGVSVSYHKANHLIQGGIEFCYSNDLGDYMVNMQTYDSTGYYESIGSFTIDPENPDSIIFDTYQVSVMDSVAHQSHEQTQNHYTYLQFPFMVGYKAMENGLFSAYIKAGPSFSLLLNRKESPLIYYNPDATIKNIANYTPTRLDASIQILISLCLQYQATEKFGIILEPNYRYYLKSVYDAQGKELKRPFGISVRGGVFYSF